MCGLGAFVKTVELYKANNVIDHLWSYGEKLIAGMNGISKELGIQDYFEANGIACSPNYTTKDKAGNASLAYRTLFSQEMINNGLLMPWIAISYAHKETELNITLEAVRKSLQVYSKALDGGIEKYLIGPAIKPVFRPFN
jgi:glutamate-1-semialdehyde 2,1-aminomutase